MVWLGQRFVSPLVRICLPTCFLTCLLGWTLSRDGLARSALRLPVSSLVSFPPVSSHACWAACCHEMVWLGQLFVSPLVSICLRRVLLQGALGCCAPRLRAAEGAFARCCCRVLLRAVLLKDETQDCCRPRRRVPEPLQAETQSCAGCCCRPSCAGRCCSRKNIG